MKQVSGILAILLLLSPATYADKDINMSGEEYSVRRLLLGGTDYFVTVGAKSVYYGKDTSRQTLDILAELTWKECSGTGSLEQETIVWMAKALGHSNNSRYTNVLDHCVSSVSNTETKKHMQQARDEIAIALLKGVRGLPFRQGELDINKIKIDLVDMDFASAQKNKDVFNELNPGQDVDTVLRGMGAPDSIKLTNVRADKVAPVSQKPAFRDKMIFKYAGVGEMHFAFGKQSGEWMLENVKPGN